MKRRVLVHRLGSLGDTVIALPCFHRIRRSFPDCDIRVLTNAPVDDRAPPLFSVLEGSGLIDGYFEYSVSTRSWRRLWRLARHIREWQPDEAVYLVHRLRKRDVLRDRLFLRACGIGRVTGLPLTDDLLSNRRGPDGLLEREAERLARCLAPLGPIDLADPANWDLHLTETESAKAREAVASPSGVDSYIVLCTGTKLALKDWGAANWHSLADWLLDNYPHRLVFVGAEADRALADAIMRGRPERCVNLCGRLSVRESAAVIAGAALFAGNDSGPMHLAQAVGTPLVAVFSGLYPPGQWFPGGHATRILYPSDATNGAILPSEFAAAVESLLPPVVPARG